VLSKFCQRSEPEHCNTIPRTVQYKQIDIEGWANYVSNVKAGFDLREQVQGSRLFPQLKKLYNLRLFRLLSEFLEFGLIAPGFSVTWQTKRADVLGLIKKLRPQNCGKELIRIGTGGDGGYLVPDDLDGIEYCFSPGVNTVSDFENQIADRGIKSFLADYSVDQPPIMRPEFTFDKKFLGATNNDKFFTLASWKEKYLKDYSGDLILQMDIEGAEYEVILNAPDELLNQFRILVIEFHSLERLFDPIYFRLFSSCFEKLLKPFCVVHIHPNNFYGCVKRGNLEIPRFMEFTLLNRKRIGSTSPVRTFPNSLDVKNVPHRKNIRLPECWYEDI
jgi:hypothetical protein